MLKGALVFIILLGCSWLYAQQNRIDSLEEVLKKAADDTNKVHRLDWLSRAVWMEGNYSKALSFANQALSIAQKLHFKPGIATSYNRMALAYGQQGIYPEALKASLAALTIEQEINDNKGIADCYNNIGNVYFQSRNYNEALENYNASLKIREQMGDRQGIAVSYNNLGNFYIQYHKYSEALKNYLAALEISKQIGDKPGLCRLYNNIGNAYKDVGNNEKGLENYLLSLKIGEETGDKFGIASAYINLGEVSINQKRYALAKNYIAKSLQFSREIGSKDEIAISYQGLSRLDSTTGDFNGAYQNFRLYNQMQDSILNEESSKQISQMKIQYETDEKDNKIKLLNKDKQLQSTEISKQKISRNYMMGGFALLIIFSLITLYFYNHRKKIQFNRQVSEVEMKALRAQMNPHFIFNSLNSIHRFLQQSDNENAGEYLIKFSRLMRLILENSRFPEIPLQSDLEALELYIQLEALRLNNRISYEIKVDSAINSGEIMIPPLILQPFVENAIWHGLQYKENGGKVIITLSIEGEMLLCVVEDNGIGREKAQKENVSAEKKESLGIKITHSRISIINKTRKTNASVKLVDLAQGLRVEILLPLVAAF